MVLVIVTAVLQSVCCLYATAAPEVRLPWQKLSPASSVDSNTDILHFEPMKAVDKVWEDFKAEHGIKLDYIFYFDVMHYSFEAHVFICLP